MVETAKATQVMVTDDFGRYRPGRLAALLMALARRCPCNWPGQRIALLIRRSAMLFVGSPVDVEVEGFRLRASLNDNVSERKYVFMPQCFDPQERALIAAELPADGVFVDIGANIGIYTLNAARRLGANGRILAFEPCPLAYSRLRYNIALNFAPDLRDRRIVLLPVGVSDRRDTFPLYLDTTNLGGNSLYRHSHDSRSIAVECLTLLEALQSQQVRHIDILKIDIEGAEEQALGPFFASAPPALLPRWLIMENSGQDRRNNLLSVMRDRGYRNAGRFRMNSVYQLAPAGVTRNGH